MDEKEKRLREDFDHLPLLTVDELDLIGSSETMALAELLQEAREAGVALGKAIWEVRDDLPTHALIKVTEAINATSTAEADAAPDPA